MISHVKSLSENDLEICEPQNDGLEVEPLVTIDV